MKIALKNKTHWRSDHIRAFITKQLPEERPDLCKRGAKALTVEVVYTRRKGNTSSSGLAVIKGNWMKVRLSKHTPDKVDFAMVIAHELAHTRGARDEYQMRHSAKYGRHGSYKTIYAWANDLPLEVTPKKTKRKPVDAKLAHAQKMFKAALTREKRATTLRKKWGAKVKYYEKKAGAPAPAPKQPKPDMSPAFRTEDYGNGEYEVFAPDGYQFSDGTHSRPCGGKREVASVIAEQQAHLEPCPEDCDCRDF